MPDNPHYPCDLSDFWDHLERTIPDHQPEPIPALDELARRRPASPTMPPWLQWSVTPVTDNPHELDYEARDHGLLICGAELDDWRTDKRGARVRHVYVCNRPRWVEHTEHRVLKSWTYAPNP